MAEKFPEDKYLLVGKATKPHGLRGEIKIYCFSGQPENYKDYKELTLLDPSGRLIGPLAVKKSRVQGKTAVVKFASIDDRTTAEKIEGLEVLVLKELLPKTKPGEYYWHQYQGKKLLDTKGAQIGIVRQLFNSGAQDILVVDREGEEALVPVTKEFIINETEDSLVVDLPPGLLEINIDPAK